jgi:hypothetical protein
MFTLPPYSYFFRMEEKLLFLPSSAMLRSVGLFRTDVSVLRIGSIFKGLNQPTMRNITEDGRIQVNRSDSLLSRKKYNFGVKID